MKLRRFIMTRQRVTIALASKIIGEGRSFSIADLKAAGCPSSANAIYCTLRLMEKHKGVERSRSTRGKWRFTKRGYVMLQMIPAKGENQPHEGDDHGIPDEGSASASPA